MVYFFLQIIYRVLLWLMFVNHKFPKINGRKKNVRIEKKEHENWMVWQVNFAIEMFATIKKKSLQISRTGHYRICIGVFRLCTGNDRLDVLLIGDINTGVCRLLCRWTGLNTVDDHRRAILTRTPTQCYGHSCFSQLDGQLCCRHRFSQLTGMRDESHLRMIFPSTSQNAFIPFFVSYFYRAHWKTIRSYRLVCF